MKIKLNIPERYILINMLPEKGNFATLTTIEGINALLYPTEDEVKKYEIKIDDRNINWSESAIEPVELEFTDSQVEFVNNLFEEMSKKEELTYRHFIISKKFKNN